MVPLAAIKWSHWATYLCVQYNNCGFDEVNLWETDECALSSFQRPSNRWRLKCLN